MRDPLRDVTTMNRATTSATTGAERSTSNTSVSVPLPPPVQTPEVAGSSEITTLGQIAAAGRDEGVFQPSPVASPPLSPSPSLSLSPSPSPSPLGWAPDTRVTDTILNALQVGVDHAVLNMAITIPEEGRIPDVVRDLGADGNAIIKQYREDPRMYTACHDVARQLGDILGHGEPRVAGSLTEDKRQEAALAAQEALNSNDPCVMHVRYSHKSQDGHSFTLVHRGVGQPVESLEAWAVDTTPVQGEDGEPPVPKEPADFYTKMHEGSVVNGYDYTAIPHEEAVQAFTNLLKRSARSRELAVTTLSRAGHLGGFEPQSTEKMTFRLEDMRLKVIILPLASQREVSRKMANRMAIMRSILNTPDDPDAPDDPEQPE